jgi:hypothetical protein
MNMGDMDFSLIAVIQAEKEICPAKRAYSCINMGVTGIT